MQPSSTAFPISTRSAISPGGLARPSTVEIALLPESAGSKLVQWWTTNRRLNYPAYQFSFDFPVTR
jgi:hypothetical protein